jgi:hypothetical protein
MPIELLRLNYFNINSTSMLIRMQNVKLIKEPDCWCGPNSTIAEPQPFRDIADGHFDLPEKEIKDLEDLIARKGKVNEFGLPPPVDFKLRGTSEATAMKQNELAKALDASNHRMKVHPEEMREKVEELWKLNNVGYCSSRLWCMTSQTLNTITAKQ